MMKSRSRRRRECRKWRLGKERREGVHAVHGGILSSIVGGVTGGIVGGIAGDVERREEAEGEPREEDSREQLIVGDGVKIAADVDGKMEGVSGR